MYCTFLLCPLLTFIKSFHSDKCEILALYALDIAPRGGKTFISSAWRLYNELATKQPDVLKTLAGDWVLDS
jgi:hypothetical protein